jgi:hypothetical protein
LVRHAVVTSDLALGLAIGDYAALFSGIIQWVPTAVFLGGFGALTSVERISDPIGTTLERLLAAHHSLRRWKTTGDRSNMEYARSVIESVADTVSQGLPGTFEMADHAVVTELRGRFQRKAEWPRSLVRQRAMEPDRTVDSVQADLLSSRLRASVVGRTGLKPT